MQVMQVDKTAGRPQVDKTRTDGEATVLISPTAVQSSDETSDDVVHRDKVRAAWAHGQVALFRMWKGKQYVKL